MEGFIKFFGTGGARFVVSSQIRATGGLWLHYRDTNLYIDPGPGAIVRINESGDSLEPKRLDGLVLTHKHLDHANDANVMIEAMTEGGFNRKGVLFCPADAMGEDPIILRHARGYPASTIHLEAGGSYAVRDVSFSTPVRHRHPVDTYGLLFRLTTTIGLIADTRYFDELPDHYPAECLIVNVLRKQPIEDHDPVEHLALDDFVRIITRVRPEVAIMTHFGMKMVQEGPDAMAAEISRTTGIRVIAAYDGMKFEF
jgi:phosphoribosyl 1,2-cyclic phosphodiesterase